MFTLTRTTIATIVAAASMAIAYAQAPNPNSDPHHPEAQTTQPTQPPAARPGMMGGQGNMMGGQGGMMGGGMMHGSWNTTSYLDSLKGRLGITAAQEPAWKDYADTVSGVGKQMQARHETMFDAMGTASWQERRDMMNRMFEARQQAFDSVHAAATRLLPSLDATQKSNAQQILPGLAARPGMMGMRGPAPR